MEGTSGASRAFGVLGSALEAHSFRFTFARDFAAAPAGTGVGTGATLKKAGKANVSNKADITLPDHSMAWDDGYGMGGYGDFDNGIDGGLDSQVEGFFDEEFELGILGGEEGEPLEFDEDGLPVEHGRGANKRGREDDDGEIEDLRSEGDMSVEAGRHVSVHASERGSVGPFDYGDFGGGEKEDQEMDMGGMDDLGLGNDWGEGFDLGGLEAGANGREQSECRVVRCCSNIELTTACCAITAPAAPSLNGDLDESLGLTPKTAADLAKKKDQPNPAKKAKLRKQVVDAVTELEWEAGRSKAVRFKEVRLGFSLVFCRAELTIASCCRSPPTSPPRACIFASSNLNPTPPTTSPNPPPRPRTPSCSRPSASPRT